MYPHVLLCVPDLLYSFVPAESAALGIVDKIFTRIQTRESVSKVTIFCLILVNRSRRSLLPSLSGPVCIYDRLEPRYYKQGFNFFVGLPPDQLKCHLLYVTALRDHWSFWTSLEKELCLQARTNLSPTGSINASGTCADFCHCFHSLCCTAVFDNFSRSQMEQASSAASSSIF